MELLQAAAAQRIWPGRTSCRCVSAKQQSTALEIVSARMGRRLDAIGLAYRQLGLDEATGRDQVFEHLVLPCCRSVFFRWPPGSVLCFRTTRIRSVGAGSTAGAGVPTCGGPCLSAPFFYVPLIGIAILSPGVALARSVKVPGQRLTSAQFGISAAVVCLTALVAAAIGLLVARRLLAWRTRQLAAYLASSEKG